MQLTISALTAVRDLFYKSLLQSGTTKVSCTATFEDFFYRSLLQYGFCLLTKSGIHMYTLTSIIHEDAPDAFLSTCYSGGLVKRT